MTEVRTEIDPAERLRQLAEEESVLPVRQFYMSFCDPNLPKGTQFLGAVVVYAQGVATAHLKATGHGLNPGGEIMIVEIPAGKHIPASHCYRLLDKTEAENLPCESY